MKKAAIYAYQLLVSALSVVSTALLTVGIFETDLHHNSAWPVAIIWGGCGLLVLVVIWIVGILEIIEPES